ncbi:MAG: hypothetical protein AAB527_03475 [Patescibacteria group bacterium]
MIRILKSSDHEPIFRCSGIEFFIRKAEIEVGVKRLEISRGVIRVSDGANVLPYFWDDDGIMVVLVHQARVAPKAVTVESPGGVIDWQEFKDESNFLSREQMVRLTMARELKEEAGIEVQPEKIELVFAEHYLPSILEGVAWGGIVEIQRSDLSSRCGHQLGQEYTEVMCWSLENLLKIKRAINSDGPSFNLWTSRLLDEVKKTICGSRRV